MALMEKAEAWLRRQRAVSAAVAVTYGRGAATNAITATMAETAFDADDGEIIVKSAVVDWLIDRAVLVLDLGAGLVEVKPQAGDRITRVMDHGSETFEVAALGGEDVYRWHGRDGGTYRIHTVRI